MDHSTGSTGQQSKQPASPCELDQLLSELIEDPLLLPDSLLVWLESLESPPQRQSQPPGRPMLHLTHKGR